jgi:hypothetical protein
MRPTRQAAEESEQKDDYQDHEQHFNAPFAELVRLIAVETYTNLATDSLF